MVMDVVGEGGISDRRSIVRILVLSCILSPSILDLRISLVDFIDGR
jgi:hypothetical protein